MLLVGLIALSLASPSAAAPELTVPAPSLLATSVTERPAGYLAAAPVVEERRWYGYQLIVSDVVSISLFVVGGEMLVKSLACPVESYGPCPTPPVGGYALVVAGLGTFGLVPPIIHLAHGQYWHAAGSVGLRVAIPLLTSLALSGTSGQAGQALLGIELLIAMIVDDTFLSDEPIPRQVAPQVEFAGPNAPAPPGSVGLAYKGSF